MTKIELPYFTLQELAEIFGYTSMNSVWNAISKGRFPIPTYRLGRFRVADKAIVREYFKRMRAQAALELEEIIPSEKSA